MMMQDLIWNLSGGHLGLSALTSGICLAGIWRIDRPVLGLLGSSAMLAGLAGLAGQQLPASASPVRAPLSMVQRLK
jgi:hypothetical protein